MQVSSALKIDPQLQTLTPRPSKRKEVKPRGLTQKSYTVPFSTRINPSLSPTTCFGNCNIYLASCPWFPRNEEQRRHAWQKSGMGADWRREGGGEKKKIIKKPHRIRPTALLASTDGYFQWECMARSARRLHATLLARRPWLPGVREAGGGEGELGETVKVEPRSLIGSCRGWPVSAPITLESSTVVKTAAAK